MSDQTEFVAGWKDIVWPARDTYWRARKEGRSEDAALTAALDVAVAIATSQIVDGNGIAAEAGAEEIVAAKREIDMHGGVQSDLAKDGIRRLAARYMAHMDKGKGA